LAVRVRRLLDHVVARETVDGIRLVFINVPYSQYFSVPLRLASFAAFTVGAAVAGAALRRPSVVFASSTPLTIGIPGLLTARLKKAPFVFEIRDLWPEVPVAIGALRSRLLIALAERLEQALYDGAERVIVLSEASRDSLLARGTPAEKLVFIPNASDNDLFRPGVVDGDFRRQHGLEGKFVALYYGAMGKANGMDQLVDAAAALQRAVRAKNADERDPGRGVEPGDVAFVAIGDGSERPRLEARIRELGLTNLLLLPPVAKERLAGIVGAADVTLTLFANHPVFQTNSPNKFFDSLAAGKPVVVNVDGWLRRIVEEGRCGVFVRADDGLALAATVAALAREPEIVARMSANARHVAERDFDRDLMAQRLAETLEEVVAEDRRRRGAAAPWTDDRGHSGSRS
jgi:glycosyltransferase involved in cell wall biosynthesis